jgi:hypothetical protein
VDRDKHDEGSLTISIAALLAATLVVSRLGGPAGMERTAPTAPEGHEGKAQTQANPELIAKPREASEEATREWRNGNKDNPVFAQRSAQINDLIERLMRGQKIDPSQIDLGFEPATVGRTAAYSMERDCGENRWDFARRIGSLCRFVLSSSGQNKIESNALTRSELGPPIALRIVGGNDHLDKLTLCLCSLRCDDEGPCAPQSTLITDLRADFTAPRGR